MEQKSNGRTIAIAAVIAVVIAICAFFAGSHFGTSGAEAEYQAERDLNILLNRSELEGLGDIEGTIYVTGHKSPDSDTVCSSIAYATLLQKLGYDAQPVVLGDVNNETEFILAAAGVEVPELMVDASGENMVLVDHSEYTQTADGLEDANVIAIIDHHGDGSVTTSNQIVYDGRPLGATATIVWIRYRNYGVEVDSDTALVLLGAILSDTKNLKSSTTTPADVEAVKALGALAGIEDTDAFFTDMFKASISHEGMSDEEIYLGDYKEYESAGRKFSIGVVEVYDTAEAEDMVERMSALLPTMSTSSDVEMSFVQVSIFHDDISITYVIPSSETAKEVIEAAFGDQAVWNGSAFVFEPGISRKQVLVPAISEVLAAHPRE